MTQINPNDLSVDQLKARAFDAIARLQKAQKELELLNNLIQQREQADAETAKEKKPKKTK